MQEVTYKDGQVFRRFGYGDAERAHREAMAKLAEELKAGQAKKVKTVAVNSSRLCPCGSGRRFQFCCLNKLGKDPEEVPPETDAQRLARENDQRRFAVDQAKVIANRRRPHRRGRGPDGSGKLGQKYLKQLQA